MIRRQKVRIIKRVFKIITLVLSLLYPLLYVSSWLLDIFDSKYPSWFTIKNGLIESLVWFACVWLLYGVFWFLCKGLHLFISGLLGSKKIEEKSDD